MTKQTEFHFGAQTGGIYRAPASTAALRARAGSQGLAWRALDLEGVAGKQAFLACCAKALAFPDAFGGNWDALADCLEDLSWQPPAGIVVHWCNGGAFARQASDFSTALEIFGAAARYWRAHARVFVVLVDADSCGAGVTAALPQR
jgi:hypothetical protein